MKDTNLLYNFVVITFKNKNPRYIPNEKLGEVYNIEDFEE